VTFPKSGMDEMGLSAGDSIVIEKRADVFYIRPSRVKLEMLAPLRGRLLKGAGSFDLEELRNAKKDPDLRN